MHLNTPEALASLPQARIIRRADAVQQVKRATRSENTFRRASARLSVMQSGNLSVSNPASQSRKGRTRKVRLFAVRG